MVFCQWQAKKKFWRQASRDSGCIEALFNDVIWGAAHRSVDPASRVPGTRVRTTVCEAVTMLKYFFQISGRPAGPDNAVVAELAR